MNMTQRARIKWALQCHEIMLNTKIKQARYTSEKSSYESELRQNILAQIALDEVEARP